MSGAPRDEGRGTGRAARAWLLASAFCLLPSAVHAQSLVETLRAERKRARVAEVLAELGPRVPPRGGLPTDAPHDPYVAQLLARRAARAAAERARLAREDSAAMALVPVTWRWAKTEPDAQGPFLDRYREAYWRAAPSVAGLALDTTATPTLRGRLQNVFGRPTRNADAFRQVGYAGSEAVQFEYWFVVNDSLPVLVMDLDGPFGRGLLVAGDEAHADLLPALKADLDARLAEALGPDPWVDYYRSDDRNQWFRTGYNGTEWFTVAIRPPAWSRRPRVDRWPIHR